MEYSRTTGFCLTSTILVAAEANAEDVRAGAGDDDDDAAAVRAELSDTENALLAVTAAAAAVADGEEFGGIRRIFFRTILKRCG